MQSVGPTFRIVIVEDSVVFRELLVEMLATIPGTEVVGHADTDRTALQVLSAARPDLAIIDLELREGTGLDVLNAIKRGPDSFGPVQTVVYSNHCHEGVQSRCQMLGAKAVFDKSFQLDELVEFVETAAHRAT